MASSSTSSIQKSFKYDVFLSFRGEDTRKTFVGHLYNALELKSIRTYKDDERIKKGKNISDELIKSIQDSRFHIIVFSKTYASSSWCLEELVKIMECQKMPEQTAYPVFYDVEPTEVRKQSGEFGESFAKFEKEEAAGKWREALKEAAGLAGWELKNTDDGHEAKFVQKIVEEISLELRSINFNADEKLVGMETRIKDVISSLEMGFDDVRMLGIKGMGGAGKTTLAKAVFDHISFQFEGSSFVENVRENSYPNFSRLKKLQKQVLKDVSNDQDIKISNVHEGKRRMKKMMCCIKVLVVLDDVDNINQLEALSGERNWFKPGSRIIITTRDEQVLDAHRVNFQQVKPHDVDLLSNRDAMCLFSRYAFGRETPIHGYEELSKQVVDYGAGLPLTMKVLGSFLSGKNELEWKDALRRLKTIPWKDTLDILEISYTGLEKEHKEIFLDVACLLKRWDKEDAIRVLESCGFYARIGLRVLEQKSLITISEYGFLDMHDRIEEMGQHIVRKLEEPNKHSRLWINEEIEDVLVSDQGTNEAIRCIKLIKSELDSKIIMKGLGNMKKLRFLHVYRDGVDCVDNNWVLDEVCEYFPNALRCLRWTGYPFGSLPKSFQANNLVELKMPYSKIVQLWKGGDKKVLNKLRFLDLSCSNLNNLDVSVTPNLETLDLKRCYDLVELHMSAECQKLKSLMVGCSKLTKLNLRGAPNLEGLVLDKCVDLAELNIPGERLKLKFITINGSKLRTLDLRGALNLEQLNLDECVDLVELNIPGEGLKLNYIKINGSKLRTLNLRGALNLENLNLDKCVDLVELNIPGKSLKLNFIIIYNASKLRTLDLRGALNLEHLNLVECVDLLELDILGEHLKLKYIKINNSKLRTLDLRGALNLENLNLDECVDLVELNIPGKSVKLNFIIIYNASKLRTLDLRGALNLEHLNLVECVDLVELDILGEHLKLKYIKINNSKLRTLDLRGTPNLEYLNLDECVDLVELNIPGEHLKLKSIIINDSKLSTLDLRGTLNLEYLNLDDCVDLVKLNILGEHLKLKYIKINDSKLRTLDLRGSSNLKYLNLDECVDLVELHIPGKYLKIKSIKIKGSKLRTLDLPFTCFYEEPRSSLIANLEKFISFAVCACTNLERLSQSIYCLTKLTLEGSISEAPKDLDHLGYLEELHLLSTKITRLPDSICLLKQLKCLELNPCWHLQKLPKDLGQLECLEKLILFGCNVLRDIPDSICKMKRLRYFQLKFCLAVEKLPEELGRLTCLEELNIEGTSITQLPQSIYLLKGLRIVGFITLLELCGFTSEIQVLEDTSFCYI